MMLVQFRLAWLKAGTSPSKGFKILPAGALFKEYTDRISKYIPCEIIGMHKETKKLSGVFRWICDLRGKPVSSDTLANQIQTLMDRGSRQLEIWIGGPDGFSDEEILALKPDFKWSFGPLTYPHELAAAVASEQIYRALTIHRKMPYHLGH